MPDDGIWISNDSYNDLSSQLFAQDARGVVADRWAQDAHDVAPDLIRQAQDAENQRQAEQQRQAESQQREADAASFPVMAAAALPDMVKSAGGDPALMAHLGGAPSPPDAPSDAGSMTDALPISPSMSPSPAPDVSAPAPALPAPSDPITTPLAAPAPAPPTSPSAPITAPMVPPPTSPNQPVTFAPATQTTAGLSGGGDLSGRIGARGQQIMSQAAQDASWLGDQGVKALQSVLLTEGGLAGARGDNGMSAGPLQFYEKGQLANFAQQFGLSLDQAKQYVETHPEEAVRWAVGSPDRPGYLGAAIQAGQKAGLQGPDLATYAQAHGQVSVSPERAGANFNALFGGGQNPIAGAGDAIVNSGAGRVVQAAVNNVMNQGRPSQFSMGLSTTDAYAACGPAAAIAFARATGQNPTAEQALALAKQVGWSAGSGMAGPSSELDLLKSMGVPAHMENGVDINKMATDVQNGNPVIVSTPGHYFVADGYDPKTGSFHVGTSGTDLKAGSEWMSLDQMQRVMGTAQATLYLDRQAGDGPSVASQMQQMPSSSATPATTQSSNPIDTFKQKLGDAFSDLLAPLQNLFGGSSNQPMTAAMQPTPSDALTNPTIQRNPTTPVVGSTQMPAAQSTIFDQVGPAVSDFAMGRSPLSPSSILQGAESTIGNELNAAPGQGPITLARKGAGQALSGLAPDMPVLGGAAQLAGGLIGQPGVSEQMQTVQDLTQKYGLNPDPAKMTPQDREAYTNAIIAVGGLVAPLGAKFDRFGVAIDQSPEAATALKAPQYDQYGVAVDQPVLPELKGATPAQAVPAQAAEVPSLGLTTPTNGPQGLIPNAVRARAIAADRAVAAPGEPVGAGSAARQRRLVASDPYGGAQPPVEPGQAFTRDPQGNIVPVPQPQAGVDLVQAMLDKAKAEGRGDPSVHEALQSAIDQQNVVARPPTEAASTSNGVPSLGLNGHGPARPPAGPPAPPTQPPPGPPVAPTAIPPSPPTGIDPWAVLRTLRVGSLAGGVQTMAHIVLNAPLQTAFKLLSDAPLTLTEPATIPLEFMGAWQGLRGWATHVASTGVGFGEPGQLAQQIGGRTGQAVETGLLGLVKTHPALQDIARQIGSNMELWRQAGVEASRSGVPRYSGQWWAEVNRLVADPTPAIQANVQRIGDNFALRGAKGEAGQAISDLMTSRFGQKWGRLVNLFFDIGYHVAAQGVEASPLGLLGTAADSAAMLANKGPYANGAVAQGVTPLAERLRNNLVGTGLAIEAYHQAAQGNITGNGPDDPKLKAELMDQGWLPESFRVGGRYFPLHILGRAGWALGEAANLYEATHTGDQGGYAKPGAATSDQFVSYAQRMAQYAENETFLRDVGQILQVAGSVKDFGRLGEQEAASLLGSIIPQGALINNIGTAEDPFTRKVQTGNLQQALQNRIPSGLGLPGRQDLPPRVTGTGTQVQNPSQGLGIFLPRNTIANPDPILTMLGQAGMGSPTIPKTIPVTSKYAVDLTPDEQYQYQVLHGQAVQQILADLPKDRDFASAPLATRQHILQQAMSKASEVARKQLLAQIPNSDLEARVIPNTLRTEQNTVTAGGI